MHNLINHGNSCSSQAVDISMGIISILMRGNPVFMEDSTKISGIKNIQKGLRQKPEEDQRVKGNRHNTAGIKKEQELLHGWGQGHQTQQYQ